MHASHTYAEPQAYTDTYKADTHSDNHTGTERSTFAQTFCDAHSQTHALTTALQGIYTPTNAHKILNPSDTVNRQADSHSPQAWTHIPLSPEAHSPHLLRRPEKSQRPSFPPYPLPTPEHKPGPEIRVQQVQPQRVGGLS